MKKILILASNPKGDLRIDREIRDLKKAVERSSQQEQFDVEIQLAVTPDSLEGLFHQYKPNIVHYSTKMQRIVVERIFDCLILL